jgi:hypothetical protein
MPGIMDDAKRAIKWRGPITLFCESRRFRCSTITVATLVLYLLSAGPYAWLSQYRLIPEWAETPMDWFYIPFWRLTFHAPDAISDALIWYVELWGSLDF